MLDLSGGREDIVLPSIRSYRQKILSLIGHLNNRSRPGEGGVSGRIYRISRFDRVIKNGEQQNWYVSCINVSDPMHKPLDLEQMFCYNDYR
jgi:hypothetical protein